MAYHRLEKGLALKSPRRGFGKDVVVEMLTRLERYHERYGPDDTVETCISVLEAYFDFNRGFDAEIDELEGQYKSLRSVILGNRTIAERNVGGAIAMTSEEVLRAIREGDFESFARSRRSIRNFVPGRVPLDAIRKALSIAQSTPSVCNRQAWRTHVYLDEERIREILKYQNGNRGFGDDAGAIMIVTAALPYFIGVGERNQAFVDGGMYAMNLVYALHSLGLGTCFLNLSLEPAIDARLHEVAGLPPDEVPIVMIAVGHLPKKFFVAASPRKSIDEVATVHG